MTKFQFILFTLLSIGMSLNAQIKVDSVTVIPGAEVPTATLEGNEIIGILKGEQGEELWYSTTPNELKTFVRPCADSIYSAGDTIYWRTTTCIVYSRVFPSTAGIDDFTRNGDSICVTVGAIESCVFAPVSGTPDWNNIQNKPSDLDLDSSNDELKSNKVNIVRVAGIAEDSKYPSEAAVRLAVDAAAVQDEVGNKEGANAAYAILRNGDEVPNINQDGFWIAQLGTSQTRASYRYSEPILEYFRELGHDITIPGYYQVSSLNGGATAEVPGIGSYFQNGTWVNKDAFSGGRGLNMTHAVSNEVGAQVRLNSYGSGGEKTNRGIVYFRRRTAGGEFKVKTQTAGSYRANVSTAGTLGVIDSVEYRYATSFVDFTIEIAASAADSTEILGVSLTDTTKNLAIGFHNLGHSGAGIFHLAGLSTYDFERQLKLLNPIPSVVIIEHGTNDFIRTIESLEINYDTVIQRTQRVLPGAQILILSPPDAAVATKQGKTIEEFEVFQRAKAKQYGCAWLSQKSVFGNLESAFKLPGIYSPDSVHLERLGGYMIGRAICNHLFPGATGSFSWSRFGAEGATDGQVRKYNASTENWEAADDNDSGVSNTNAGVNNIPKMSSSTQIGASPMTIIGDEVVFGGSVVSLDAAISVPGGKKGIALGGGNGVGNTRWNYREALYNHEKTVNAKWNGINYTPEHTAAQGWIYRTNIQPGGVNEEQSVWVIPQGASPSDPVRIWNMKYNGYQGFGLPYPENPTQMLHVRENIRIEGAYYDSDNSPGTNRQRLISTAVGATWVDSIPVRRVLISWGQNSTTQSLAVSNTWYPITDQGSVVLNSIGGISGITSPNLRFTYTDSKSDLIQVRCSATLQSLTASKDIKVGFRKNTDAVDANSQKNIWAEVALANYEIVWEYEYNLNGTTDYTEPVISSSGAPVDVKVYNLQCRLKN